jgi:hypothetical protein
MAKINSCWFLEIWWSLNNTIRTTIRCCTNVILATTLDGEDLKAPFSCLIITVESRIKFSTIYWIWDLGDHGRDHWVLDEHILVSSNNFSSGVNWIYSFCVVIKFQWSLPFNLGCNLVELSSFICKSNDDILVTHFLIIKFFLPRFLFVCYLWQCC